MCGQTEITPILNLVGPLARYGFEKQKSLSVGAKKFEIELVNCNYCGHLFNNDFDIRNINYASDMISEGRKFSTEYTKYMKTKAYQISGLIENQNGTVIEIGSGDSYFLSLFEKHNKIGFEPSVEATKCTDSKLTIHNEYFDPKHDYGFKASLVILRHVLEHLENPVDFMMDTVDNLEPDIVFLEVPNGGKTKSENRIQDVYYEHRSYFTTNSLAYLIMRIGYEIQSISEDFNSEIISLIAKKNKFTKIDFTNIDDLISRAQEAESVDAPTMIWGASGNGTIIARRAIEKGVKILAVIDSDENKHDRYLPTTDIKIVSPENGVFLTRELKTINLIIASQLHAEEISKQALDCFHGKNLNIIC